MQALRERLAVKPEDLRRRLNPATLSSCDRSFLACMAKSDE
jgi:hypothetical protein